MPLEQRAASTAQLVEAVGFERACELTGYEPHEITAYLELHEERATAADGGGPRITGPDVE